MKKHHHRKTKLVFLFLAFAAIVAFGATREGHSEQARDTMLEHTQPPSEQPRHAVSEPIALDIHTPKADDSAFEPSRVTPNEPKRSGILFDNAVLVDNLDGGSLSLRGCGAAWDGTYYWTAMAGNAAGNTLNQYDAGGTLMNAFQTGVDHRSIFTDAAGNVFATDYGGGDGIQVYRYVNGVPTLLYTLSATPDIQMEMGLRFSNNTLYGHSNGQIYAYDFANGNATGNFTLNGYSQTFPANTQIAVVGEVLLTYDDLGNVAAWDFAGNNLGTCTVGLNAFDQIVSFSFSNGLLWIETVINGVWNGYDIGLRVPACPLVDTLDPGDLGIRPCGIAWDGTYYWSGNVGTTLGKSLNQYDAGGALIGVFETGVDHRSLFTDASNNLYASDFGGGGIQIYQYTNAVPTLLYTLSTNPDSQMELGLRIPNNTLYGHSQGTVYMYDFADGNFLGSFTLNGYSAGYPANVQFAVLEDYLLTYNDDGDVVAWDYAGNMLSACNIGLIGFDQTFSFSFAAGLIWIETSTNGGWNGYDAQLIPLGAPVIAVAPNALVETLPVGGMSTQMLNIQNRGGTDLFFNVHTTPGPLPIAELESRRERIDETITALINRSGITRGPIVIDHVGDGTTEGIGQTIYREPRQIARVMHAPSPAIMVDVAVLGSPALDVWNTEVQGKLLNTGYFSSVTVINIATVTPTLAELMAFDAVLVYSDSPGYQDDNLLGDVLADYVDAGYGVVCAVFSTASIPFDGRFNAENYWAIAPSGQTSGTREFLGTIYNPGHPLMAGVSGFDGGTSSYRPTATETAAGAVRVADWTDGRPLVATKVIGTANRADLGFYPPSSDSRADFWESATDGDILMANALVWVAGVTLPEWLTVNPRSGTVVPGSSTNLAVHFDATGLSPGAYFSAISIVSNDPVTPVVIVPASLEVTPACISDGDVNNDGNLTAGDALCCFNIALLASVPPDCDVPNWDCEIIACDVNCNFTLTAGDALEIFNFSLAGGTPQECFAQFSGVTASTGEESNVFDVPVRAAVSAGNTLTVPVLMEAARGAAAFGFEVRFDPDEVAFEGLTIDAAAAHWKGLGAAELEPGLVRVMGFDTEGLKERDIALGGKVEIAKLSFQKLSIDAYLGSVEWIEQRLDRQPNSEPEATSERVTKLELSRPYPNPFRDAVSADVRVPMDEMSTIRVAVYDVKGRHVRTLLNDAVRGGIHTISWDRRTEAGQLVSSGIYFIQMRSSANGVVDTKKLVVIK